MSAPASSSAVRTTSRSRPAESGTGARFGRLEAFLRPYPYPYRAALSLCPDCDGLTADRMQTLRRLWQSMGLDIAFSFFAYSRNPESPPQASYFDGDAEAIREGVLGGWIDKMHGFGDFPPEQMCTRSDARNILEEFLRKGMRLRIWVNHGGPQHKVNLKIATACGDVPDEREASHYVSDLLLRYGIRFIWASDLTHVVGQQRSCTAREYYVGYPACPKPMRLAAWGAHLLGWESLVRKLGIEPFKDNRLFRLLTLRDNRRVFAFRRFGYWRRDTLDKLPEILAPSVLDRLVHGGGMCILYLHVGPPPGETPEGLRRGMEVCRELARRRDRGGLWVVRTLRQLEYAVLRSCLHGEVSRRDGRLLYTISHAEDPLAGAYRPDPQELEGLTFYSDDPLRTEVRLADWGSLAVRINPPDHAGRSSVTLTGP